MFFTWHRRLSKAGGLSMVAKAYLEKKRKMKNENEKREFENFLSHVRSTHVPTNMFGVTIFWIETTISVCLI